ncbi:MAG: hypothetical protein APR53_08800 [Methanoculleus sp. SDB]|nr:MAG: hypothetical protein APR53_08800 [Methanoculleus sp. SDB]
MDICEIHLNRRGINSIETPPQVEVEAGSSLLVRLINDGSPVHVTLTSSNAGMFTDFYHENLYVRDILDFRIATREDAYAGFFDIGIITGYGTKRSQFRVLVKKYSEHQQQAPDVEPLRPPVSTAPFPWLLLLLVAIGTIAYAGWLTTGETLLSHLTFIVLLSGVYFAWYSRR